MPTPTYCPNPACPHHVAPPPGWRVRFGTYPTIAHGTVQRYRCRACGRTMGDQTESVHYFAKRRLPLRAVWATLAGGACLREAAWRYHTSPLAIQNAVLRLGRQAMAAQAHLLHHLAPRSQVVFDGLRSYVVAKDHPCDLTTVVDRPGETILTITHTIMGRGGTMTPAQAARNEEKMEVWQPQPGTFTRDLTVLVDEIWDYLRPCIEPKAIIDTDEQPTYKTVIDAHLCTRHFRTANLVTHRRTLSTAPRDRNSPLFPVNYVDRLLRHRVKEHMRKTIAFGRHASLQMHRAWIFAWEHNLRRPWRVRPAGLPPHAEHGTDLLPAAVEAGALTGVQRQFFTRRIRLLGTSVPRTMRRVWRAELPTPPVLWRKGQKGTTVRVPWYAIRDLAQANQQGCG